MLRVFRHKHSSQSLRRARQLKDIVGRYIRGDLRRFLNNVLFDGSEPVAGLTSVKTSRGNSSILASFPVFFDFLFFTPRRGSSEIKNELFSCSSVEGQ